MTDVHDTATRRRNMQAIGSKNTKPELTLRKALWNEGIRYRLHYKNLPGKPDIVLPGKKLAIFVHGCFWHQHVGCKYAGCPKNNHEFWNKKLSGNRIRDSKNEAALKEQGWKVHIVWECELKESIEKVLTSIKSLL